jgi:hypothetical protein
MTKVHNGMQQFDTSNVPEGTFWYRCEYKIKQSDKEEQTKLSHWEIVRVHDMEHNGRRYRKLSAQYWSEKLADLVKKNVVAEFYQIPLPPGHPDEAKTQEPESASVRPVGSVARPNG